MSSSNSIIKAIQGTFHQGDNKFGESVGKQCTCCSLFSIVFTVLKHPGNWNSHDLDFIVEKGDEIYKSLNQNDYLLLTDTIFRTPIRIH